MPHTQKSYDVLEATLGMCPDCLATVPAKIVRQDGRVYLHKHCPRHGEQTELLEHNAAYFTRRNDFSRPGTGCKLQTARAKGCPFDCGLCPEHEQHTCIGLIEVTTGCDMGCPVCYADAGPASHLPLADIRRMIDFYIDSEHGHAEILQVSGGEPTTHPEILDILRHARSTSLAYVMLNTNGLRLASDPAFVGELAGFVGGFEVYLQFDGLSAASCRVLRGGDYVARKLAAVEALGRHNIPTTLVMTVQAGVNDHEIGEVLAFAMRHRHIRGVNFQPAAFFGRRPATTPTTERSTLTGILERIEKQTAGLVQLADFVPLPCDVDRVAVNFLYRVGGEYRPILRGVDCRKYLPHIRNTFNFRAEEFLAEAKTEVSCCNIGELLKFLSPQFLLRSRPERVAYINDNLFRLSVVSFVDAYNFDLKSMQKECVHVITPDLRKIPFSAYNLVHRHAHA
jgi:7,8-dihydro-6-hydroxymethylpterin dimethyltransferase